MARLPEAIFQPSLAAVGMGEGCEVVAGDQLGNLGKPQQGIKEG